MSLLPIKLAARIENERAEIAKSIESHNKRERRLSIRASLNYATYLVLEEARHDGRISYADLYEFWAEEMDAPEEDFREELDEGLKRGVIEVCGSSRYAPDADYSLRRSFIDNYYLGEDVD